MDRISALRNVEKALSAFERGEIDLAELERRIGTVLRTYATEFDDDSRTAFRAVEPPAAEDRVVAAESESAARERVRELLDGDPNRIDVERIGAESGT